MKIDMEFIQEITKDLDGSCRDRTGNGKYASVFDSDMPNLVIKKGTRTQFGNLFDDGWLFYAIWCMKATRRPSWMPKIYNLLIDYEKGEFFAAMERLEEGEAPYITGRYDTVIEKLEGNSSVSKRVGKSIASNFKKMNDSLLESFDLSFSECIFVDAHDDNWMKRGRKLVLTDPFCILYEIHGEMDKLLKFNQDMVKFAADCDDIVIKGTPKIAEGYKT